MTTCTPMTQQTCLRQISFSAFPKSVYSVAAFTIPKPPEPSGGFLLTSMILRFSLVFWGKWKIAVIKSSIETTKLGQRWSTTNFQYIDHRLERRYNQKTETVQMTISFVPKWLFRYCRRCYVGWILKKDAPGYWQCLEHYRIMRNTSGSVPNISKPPQKL